MKPFLLVFAIGTQYGVCLCHSKVLFQRGVGENAVRCVRTIAGRWPNVLALVIPNYRSGANERFVFTGLVFIAGDQLATNQHATNFIGACTNFVQLGIAQ